MFAARFALYSNSTTLSGDLEPAWKGLSRDNFQPNIKLERDFSLNVCNDTGKDVSASLY